MGRRQYVRYFVSTIPLLLGFFWMLWDAKNQTWHDKLAGTVVVHTGS
ncbi:RDD family protein [Salinispirillum marinum]|uniref:RDD family protein n=2 Tax=Saccharospirillaceae TaxID=255527 RepID=A0ABV8BJB4_9GAMM